MILTFNPSDFLFAAKQLDIVVSGTINLGWVIRSGHIFDSSGRMAVSRETL